jgi:Ca-activated chloride channel family protein
MTQTAVPFCRKCAKYDVFPCGKPIEGRLVVKRATVVLTLLTTGVFGLGPGAIRTAGQTPTVTFRSGVEAVTVTATVRDARGRVVKDLEKADFEVLDGGRARQIQDFHSGDAAVSLSVLLDISGSMSVGGNMDRAREAVNVALGNLQSGRDEASLFTFDSELQEVRPFTTNLNRITSVRLEGKPWGLTSLYDAIGATARRVAERTNRHRAVLVITDGVDTGSRMTPPQVSYVASSIDVPVYLLVVSNPVDNPGHKLAVLAASGQTGANTATLADLARWTGGDMAIASELADSTKALTALMGNLRHQYLISFEPGARPGWHPLEVRTRKKNLTVHARSGYLAGSARTGS